MSVSVCVQCSLQFLGIVIQSVFNGFGSVLARVPRRKEFSSLIVVSVKNQFFRAFSIWDLLTLCPISLLGEVVNSPAQLCALCQKSLEV